MHSSCDTAEYHSTELTNIMIIIIITVQVFNCS